MRTWVCLLLAACGSGSGLDAASDKAPATPPEGSAREAAKASKVSTIGPVSSTHGSTIIALAVTDDGNAVVSADQQGGIRLWPVLDGTREPIVISGSAPHALGIARDGDGFVIADHDAAGGVELIRTSSRGEVRGRSALPSEPRIEQLEMTAEGAIVLRADQTIELLDPSGVSRARLVPPIGAHVTALVTRGSHVLAIEVEGKDVRAHAIELGKSGARWGESSAKLPIDPDRAIELSPDLHTIAALRATNHHAVLVDLATGKPDAARICGAEDSDGKAQMEMAPESGMREDMLPQPLGFYDDKTVACSVLGQLQWFSTSGTALTVEGKTESVSTFSIPIALGERRVIAGIGHQLALYSPAGNHYLGYGFRELTHVRVGPTGVMIGKGDQQPLLLDAHLHERARFQLPKQNVDWTDLLPIDDRYVITVANQPQSADAWGNAYQVSVYDAVKHTVHQLLPYRAHESELTYEASTRLLVSSDGGANLLLRFDPTTHSFGERLEIQTKLMIKQVYLVDPALADGIVAIAVRDDEGGLTALEIHGDDLKGGIATVRRTYRISGELRAVDRAGRLYVHAVMDKDDVAIYTAGARTATLPGTAAMTLRPSSDGTRVAAFGNARIALLASDGKKLWETAAWGSTDVGWTPSGELFGRFQGALVKIDPLQGTLTERQCGWAFGLSETMFETSANTPIVCDVAP